MMQVVRVRCRDGKCTVEGEITTTGPADLVFAYTPTSVRYDSRTGYLVLDFDPPVDCDFFVSHEHGVAYLYCAPVLRPVHLVEENGEYYLEEGEENGGNP